MIYGRESGSRPGPAHYYPVVVGTESSGTILGIVVDEVSDGAAVATLAVTESMLNHQGACHGGIIFTLADTAMEHASNFDGSVSVASHAEVDYVRPAGLDDRLLARASVTEAWGRTKLVDVAVLRASDGQVIARFRGRTRATARR